MKRQLLCFATAVLLCVTLTAAAMACSCIAPGPPKESMEKATAVFQGKVTKIELKDGSYHVSFAISRSWKGIASETTVVKTATSSAACGFGFEEDKEYVVYCYGKADSGLATNICTRTRTLEFAKEDIEALGEGRTFGKDE